MKRLLALVLPLAGCVAPATSNDHAAMPSDPGPSVTTSGALSLADIVPDFLATSDGTALTVYATLATKDLTSVIVLDSGDSLSATAFGKTIVMVRDPLSDSTSVIGAARYSATFAAAAPDTVVEVAFVRGKETAPKSSVVVPSAFTILSPPPSSFHAKDSLAIALPPSALTGVDLDVVFEGPCLLSQQDQIVLRVSAAGDATVDTSKLVFDPKSNGAGCDLNAHVERVKTGLLDAAFTRQSWSPEFAGVQVRSFTTTVVR